MTTWRDPDERREHLVPWLDRIRTIGACPVCGAVSWELTLVHAIPKAAPNPERLGFYVLPLTCTICAHVRLHSLEQLERLAAESPIPPDFR